MSQAIQYAVFGLGICATYSLLAQGLIVIYGGSGVLNFAQAAMATFAAYLYYQGRSEWLWGFAPSFVVPIVILVVLGVGIYHGVMRPLRNASPVAKAIASLGVLILIQGVIALIWKERPRNVAPIFPQGRIDVRDVLIQYDRIFLVSIALALTVILWAAYRYLPVGLAIRASAENQRSAATLGWSPHTLATITWALGGFLAAVAGMLIASVIAIINPEEMPFFILPVLAAALVGGFTSFWVTFAASFVIGVAQSLFIWKVPDSGWTWGLKQSLPFLVIIVILVIRGQGLPVRGQVIEKMFALGSGRVRWKWLLGIALAWLLGQLFWWDTKLQEAFTVSWGWGIVMLSVVVLLGYTGQLSLAQFALAGVAALASAHLVVDADLPFELAFLFAVLITIPVGLLFAIPALRTRGINLAVVTLGLAMATNSMIFTNNKWTGESGFLEVGAQEFFGVSVDSLTEGKRYTILGFALLVLCGLAVASIRRGVVGRRLIAVRTNERAAAALGISVLGVKMYAFGLAAAIAGVGGVLLAFRAIAVSFSDFIPRESILSAAYSVIGGVGYVLGAPFGSQFPHGGLGTWILENGFTWWVMFVLGLVFSYVGTTLYRGLGRQRGWSDVPAITLAAAVAAVTAVGLRVLFESFAWWLVAVLAIAVAALVGLLVSHLARTGGGSVKAVVLRTVGSTATLTIGTMLLFSALFRRDGATWGDARFHNPNPNWLVVVGGITVIVLIVLHPDGAISVNAEIYHILARKLRRLFRMAPQPRRVSAPLPEGEREPVKPAVLEASNITVRFGGVVAVDDVSVTVNPGEVVGLIGPNGAGKTTLIDAITGFVKPAAGAVTVDGEPIGTWPVYKRARLGVSRSFQQLELFESLTVRENLMTASDGYSVLPYFKDIAVPTNPPLSSTATAAVKILELEQYLDERVSDLPYGRRRLVAIARAIAVSPSVLLLDEPAAGLSATETAELATIVKRLAQEWRFAILVIEHDMSFVMSVCDHITVLDFGRQIATGTPAEIRRNPAVIAAYLGEEGAEAAAGVVSVQATPEPA